MSVAALVAFAGVFSLGVIFAILGSIKLKLVERLSIDDAQVGKLFSTLMFSALIASLIIGPLTDIAGYGAIAFTGFALSGISLWLLAVARSYRSAVVACFLLGIAAIGVNTGNVLGPTVLFDGQDPSRASNLLNILFGLGALITPLILAFAIGAIGYKKTVGLIGAILFVQIVLPFFAEFPSPGRAFDFVYSLRLLANPAVVLGGMGLFCSIAVQSCLAGFITTYLKSYQFSDATAGTLLSGFWVALILARIIATTMPPAVAPGLVLPIISLLMAITIGIMIIVHSPFAAAICALLSGFFLGPVFPTLVGESLSKTDAIAAGTAGSVFGLIFAAGLCGGIIVPTLTGKYAVKQGIRRSFRICLFVAIALTVISSVFYFVPTMEAELPEEAIGDAPVSAIGIQDLISGEPSDEMPGETPP